MSMYCIQLICESGGSKTVLRKTLAECTEACSQVKSRFVAATLPFEVFMTSADMYDVSITADLRDALGEDIMNVYLKQAE